MSVPLLQKTTEEKTSSAVPLLNKKVSANEPTITVKDEPFKGFINVAKPQPLPEVNVAKPQPLPSVEVAPKQSFDNLKMNVTGAKPTNWDPYNDIKTWELIKEGFRSGTLQTGSAVESMLGIVAKKIGAQQLSDRLENLAVKDKELASVGIQVDDPRKLAEKMKDPKWVASGLAQNLPNLLFGIGVSLPVAVAGGSAAAIGGAAFLAGATLEGGFAYQDAKEYGADDKTAEKVATVVGIANGLLEALPIANLFNRPGIGKELKRNLISVITGRVIKQMGEESGTESLQQIVSNSIAEVYDKNRNVLEGVPESAFFGGIMGGGSSLVFDTFTNEETKDRLKQAASDQSGFIKIPSNQEQSLIEEAKKYKSADEFVKAQGEPLYHGTNENFEIFDKSKIGSRTDDGLFGRGFYFGNTESFAKVAASGRPSKNVMKVYAPDIKLFNISEVTTKSEMANMLNMSEDALIQDVNGIIRPANSQIRQFTSHVKELGYDGVVINRGGDAIETVIFEPEKIFTTNQLTDIWNQAQKETVVPIMKENKTAPVIKKVEPSVGDKFLASMQKEITQKIESKIPRVKLKIAEQSRVARIKAVAKERTIADVRKAELRGFRNTIKRNLQGIKEGTIKTKKQIAEVQGDIISRLNDSNLEAKDKAKFISFIKNTQTTEQLNNKLSQLDDRIESLEEKASIRKIKADIIKELKTTKISKQSGKPIGKFTPEIQKNLDALRSVMRMTKSQALDKINSNFKKYSDVDFFPPEIILQNRILNEIANGFTEENGKKLLSAIKSMKETGAMENALKKYNIEVEKQRSVEYVIDRVSGGIDITNGAETFGTNDPKTKEGFKRTVATFGIKMVMDWHGLMDLVLNFNNDVDNKVKESFYNTIDQDNKYKELEEGFTNDFSKSIMDAYGLKKEIDIHKQLIKLNEEVVLGEFVNAKGVKGDIVMTRDEMIKRWMEMQDETLLESLKEGNSYTDEIMGAINNEMTEEDRAFANAQFKIYKDQWEKINPVYRDIYGVDLPFNEFYSPIRRKGFKVDELKSVGEFLTESTDRRALSSKSFKTRQQSLLPIELQSSIDVLSRHIKETNYFIAWAERIRRFKQIFNNQQVRDSIKDNFGDETMRAIDNSLNDLTTNGNRLARRSKLIDGFRKGFSLGSLIIKPSIGIKQLVSTLAYLEKIGPVDFLSGMIDFWSNPIENIKTLNKESSFIRTRGEQGNMERDINAVLKSNVYTKWTNKKNIFNAMALNIKIGDKGAIVMGAWIMRKASLKNGISINDTIRKYEEFSASTQQSADISRLSEWQRGDSLYQLFSAFKSSPRQYLQKEIIAVRSLLQDGGLNNNNIKKVARILAVYHVILPVTFQYIANLGGWSDEDKKDYLRAGILGSLNGLFIVGDVIDGIIRAAMGLQVWDSSMPLYAFFNDMVEGVKQLNIGDTTEEDIYNALKYWGRAGNATGLPITYTKGAIAGIDQIMQGNYNRGVAQLLGWSEYISNKRFSENKTDGIKIKPVNTGINKIKINKVKVNKIKLK